MTRNILDDPNEREDEGGGGGGLMNLIHSQQEQREMLHGGDSEQQRVDIFVRHVGQQLKREQENRERRPSLPADAIELPTLNGVVMRRKQQLQLRYQQQNNVMFMNQDLQHHKQQQQQASTNSISSLSSKQMTTTATTTTISTVATTTPTLTTSTNNNNKGRPLSICSISSAASSGSSSSANSSASSGVQSSLTRNGSLNYGLEYRRSVYLASIESLNNPQSSLINANLDIINSTQSIEAALKSLSLSPSGQFRDAATRAAVLAAGAQSRGFNNNNNNNKSLNEQNCSSTTSAATPTSTTTNHATSTIPSSSSENCQHSSSMSSLFSSSTSHSPANTTNNRFARINRSLHASLRYDKSTADRIHLLANARALLHNAQQQQQKQQDQLILNGSQSATTNDAADGFNQNHHYNNHQHQLKLRRGSVKLQPSPSSASSHSNSSSLFRDDGFEDDLTSNGSENLSTTSSSNNNTTSTTYHQHNNNNSNNSNSSRPSFNSTKTPGYWDSNLSITQRVITEIIETERTYVDDLEQIVTGYICYLRNVLKQQKQQILDKKNDSNTTTTTALTSSSSSTTTNRMVNIDNNSSSSSSSTKTTAAFDYSNQIISFDYEENAESNVNEIDDDDIDDNDISIIKENFHNNHEENSFNNCNISNNTNNSCTVGKVSHHSPASNKELEATKLTTNGTSKLLLLSSSCSSPSLFNTKTSKSTLNNQKSCNINKNNDISKVNINGAIITINHIKRLFSNLEEIYKFNKDLLFALEECYLNPGAVAECFVENASGFDVYTHYCTMYPQVVTTLTELMANQESAQLLRERQIELNQGLPLGAYLLKPVQRILKYHLLFQSLIKYTHDDETINQKERLLISEAFSVMTNIASHINAMKKRHEHAIRVQEVQGLLCGWNGPDLTTLGELILEDTFKLFNKPKSSRHLFLFDNVLLFTKKKRDGSLCYKGHIACSNLMLIEKIDGQPLVFNTVPFDNPKALHAFQAKNLDKKRDWCLQMKEVIIKSFEVKIPLHVRDILMALTTNGCGSDLDQAGNCAPGSTTTSTSSSASSSETARLLKAPNYLEKKRAKQQQQQDKRR